MKCSSCGSKWSTPDNIKLTACPFCNKVFFDAEKACGITNLSEFLKYTVSIFGPEIYNNPIKLSNIFFDCYKGERKLAELYRKLISNESLSVFVYNLSQVKQQDRETTVNSYILNLSNKTSIKESQIINVVESFIDGLGLYSVISISAIKNKKSDKSLKHEEANRIVPERIKQANKILKLLKGIVSLFHIETYKQKQNSFISGKHECNAIPSALNNKNQNKSTIVSGIKYSSNGEKLIKCDKNKLETCIIEEGTKIICESAFYFCSNLKSIIIPNTVTEIEDSAFIGCMSLKQISIPSSVKKIGSGIFEYCHSLRKINLEENSNYIFENGLFYSKKGELIWCSNFNESAIIPYGITDICKSAFNNCKKLEEVHIPNSVKRIESFSFYGCINLKAVEIPNSVIKIGYSAFQGCKSLNKLYISKSVKEIETSAFRECPQLHCISIPKGSWKKFYKLLSRYKKRLIEI